MERIVIIGAGESGMGAALLAKQKGFEVFVTDAGKITGERLALLEKYKINYEEEQHTLDRILPCSEVIKSPGIPMDNPLVLELKKLEIPVIDELEFAYRYTNGKVIAITGTNGKTTTALLTYHLMKTSGMDVGLAGNVGASWAGQLTDSDKDWWVLEVSSFQIDGFKKLKPSIAIITNITPDHLDRYGYQLENYIQSKLQLLGEMEEKDDFIFFGEDNNIKDGLTGKTVRPKTHEISLERRLENGSFYDGNHIRVKLENNVLEISKKDIALRGDHNMINVMCALNAALLAGADQSAVRTGLKNFKNAAHRLEEVREINGVKFINDSKGTNVDATAYALTAFEAPLVWIAGGVDKGNDYSRILPVVSRQVKVLICLGKDNGKLLSAFEGIVPEITETEDIQEAVEIAFEKSEEGDVVLLSPACASFDLFRNYEDRGDQFKNAVNQLPKKKIEW